jgi:hypothetical protein
MRAREPKDIEAIFREGTLIDEALAEGAREALLRHKRAGCPIVVWENGKVVRIPASKIRIPAKGKKLGAARRRGKA